MLGGAGDLEAGLQALGATAVESPAATSAPSSVRDGGLRRRSLPPGLTRSSVQLGQLPPGASVALRPAGEGGTTIAYMLSERAQRGGGSPMAGKAPRPW